MAEQLIDSFGRVHRDLRISITDRCNFRCVYCMPEEGMAWTPRDEILTFEEIERLARLLVERFGVDAIRITGGEPMVRAHLPVLIGKLAALGVDLAMTTNGATLASAAADLRAAGLRRINVSLDTFVPERFVQLTRRDSLDSVLAGIDAAVGAGFDPVKVNCVVMKGVNDDEILDFAAYGRDRGVVVRFIEFMPLDADQAWSHDKVMPLADIVGVIGAAYDIEPLARTNAPASTWRYTDGGGEFGVIATVTDAFCDTCDRIRLTAEGRFRNCLFAVDELDLRGLLRGGATDDDLAEALRASVAAKWAGHQIGQVHFIRPKKSMSQIGG